MTVEDEKLLMAEYEHFSESFWRNEEVGEKRVNFFVALTTAIIAGIVALVSGDHPALSNVDVKMVATFALCGTFLFGLITYLRMLHRNRVTDEYKRIIKYLREELRRRSKNFDSYKLPFGTGSTRLLRGGLAETVAVMNGLILAAIATIWLGQGWGWLAPPVVFAASFALQAVVARKARQKNSSPSQTFRAGVGAVILDQMGDVLAMERKDITGAWQMPQGGLDEKEEPLKAVKREVFEETGIGEDHLQLLSTETCLLAYELPEEHRSAKTGRGQVQYWFLFRFNGPDSAITLGDKKEFRAYRWMSMDELAAKVVPFKQPVYQQLAKKLSDLPKST